MQNQHDNKVPFLTHLEDLTRARGQQRPVASVLFEPQLAAEVSKLVRPNDRTQDRMGEHAESGLLYSGVGQIAREIMSRMEDNANINKLFPDIELAAQIVISSIMSPKDMVSQELIYTTQNMRFPEALVSRLLKIAKEEMNGEYKLSKDSALILRQALFETGSYVRLVLPEAAVDHVINQRVKVSNETIHSLGIFARKDFSKLTPKGILGNSDTATPSSISNIFVGESMAQRMGVDWYKEELHVAGDHSEFKDDYLNVSYLVAAMESTVKVSDNDQFLKFPLLSEAVNEEKLAAVTGSALSRRVRKFAAESMAAAEESKKLTAKEMEGLLYKEAPTDYKPFTIIPTKSNLRRKSIGRPLIMNIPSCACIPVHIPGSPQEQIGFFIPTDEEGNPLTPQSGTFDGGGGLNSMMTSDKANSSLSSMLTERARKNLTDSNITTHIERASTLYAEIVERDLLERLSKGAYGKRFQVARNNEIYRIMMTRTLRSQMTRLIYVPAEYVTYFAFKYNSNGVGKSYLDDLSNITSLRAMVLYSKVMAKVKSSIEQTDVHVTLDPRDGDPIKTTEMAKHFVIKSRQQYFPHGLNRVVDLTDWIQRAGVRISFEGHPGLPNTKFAFESKNMQHVEPDDTLDEQFRHQTYMHFGLSPETVDNAAKSDFATTVEQNGVLFAQRIKVLSDLFSAMLTDTAQKTILNDEVIISRLVEALNDMAGDIASFLTDEEKEHYSKDPVGFTYVLVQEFVDSLSLDLPKPDSTQISNQKKAFDDREQLLESALKYAITEDMLPAEYAGKATEYLKMLREAYKAKLMRDWMAANSVLPEIFELSQRTEADGAGNTLLAQITSYNESIMKNVVDYMKKIIYPRMAGDKDLTKIEELVQGQDGGDGSDAGAEDAASGGNMFEEIPEPDSTPKTGEDAPAPSEPGSATDAFDAVKV